MGEGGGVEAAGEGLGDRLEAAALEGEDGAGRLAGGCGVGDSVGPDCTPELFEEWAEAAAWVEGEAREVEVDGVGEGCVLGGLECLGGEEYPVGDDGGGAEAREGAVVPDGGVDGEAAGAEGWVEEDAVGSLAVVWRQPWRSRS